jgi:hypothetical protein
MLRFPKPRCSICEEQKRKSQAYDARSVTFYVNGVKIKAVESVTLDNPHLYSPGDY